MIKDLIPDTLTPYGDWYKIGGYNRLGRECYAMISWRNAPTNVTELIGAGDSPIEISTSFNDKDFFDPVFGTKCAIKIQAEEYDERIRFATGDDTEFRVRVIEKDHENNDKLLFRGFLRPETYEQDYGLHKPTVTIEATDGLGLLKHIKFPRVDDTPIHGRDTVADILSYILYQAGNRDNWLDFISYRHSWTLTNFARSLELPTAKYYDWSLYEVLEDILSILKAQIVQIDGKYAIRLADRPEDMHVDEITYDGNLHSSVVIDNSYIDLYDNYEGAAGQLSVERPINKLIFENTLEPVENLVYNGHFKKGDAGWVTGGFNPDWEVKDNELIIYAGPEGTFYADETIDIPYVETETFDRGVFENGRGHRLLVTVDIRGSGYFRVSCGNLNYFRVVKYHGGSEGSTHTTQVILLPGEDKKVAISQCYLLWTETQSPYTNYETIDTRIKSVKVQVIEEVSASTNIYADPLEEPEQPDEIVKENIVELDTNNSEEKEITIAWYKGNPYVHKNALWHQYIWHRNHTWPAALWSSVKNRVKGFYHKARQRLNVDFYAKEDSSHLYAYSLIFDKYLRRVFVPMSYTYDLLKCHYDIELIEYRKATTAELMTWILADGTWDDDGYWMDTEKWND